MDLNDAVNDAASQAARAQAYQNHRHQLQHDALQALAPQVEDFLARMKACRHPGTERVSVMRRNWRGKSEWTGAKGWHLYGNAGARVATGLALLTDGHFVVSGRRVRIDDLLANPDEQAWGSRWHDLASSAEGVVRALGKLLIEHGVESPVRSAPEPDPGPQSLVTLSSGDALRVTDDPEQLAWKMQRARQSGELFATTVIAVPGHPGESVLLSPSEVVSVAEHRW